MDKEKPDWLGKPYYSLNAYFRHTYGEKLYKIAVDAGLSCPNRDGTLDKRGCVFCSMGGSGDFAVKLTDTPYTKQYTGRADDVNVRHAGGADDVNVRHAGGAAVRYADGADDVNMRHADVGGMRCESGTAERKLYDVKRQIARGTARFHKSVGGRFVIYFQAFTNTYGPTDYLRKIWTAALEEPSVAGISIATRPDCLGADVLALLGEMKDYYGRQGKFIWIELGLQTIHARTAEYIRRGYFLVTYEDAVRKLTAIGIPYITHIILGLPDESRDMMLATVRYVSDGSFATCESGEHTACRPFGIKLQLLHVLEGTDLADDYRSGRFEVLEKDEYISLAAECLRVISPDIVIHRVTGDGPKRSLIAPTWSANKKDVLNSLHKYMAERQIMQGQACRAKY